MMEPGGIMYRPFTAEQAVNFTAMLDKAMKIPHAHLRQPGEGRQRHRQRGHHAGFPTEIAATDDVKFAERLGTICGREGAAVGANWAFAPIIDIDYNFRNPITNTRTFGSDPERVKNFGRAYVENVQKYKLAASIKAFPRRRP